MTYISNELYQQLKNSPVFDFSGGKHEVNLNLHSMLSEDQKVKMGIGSTGSALFGDITAWAEGDSHSKTSTVLGPASKYPVLPSDLYEINESPIKWFDVVKFVEGKSYLYHSDRTFTNGRYSRAYPARGHATRVNHLLRPVLVRPSDRAPGHVLNDLTLSQIDVANFSRTYPKTKRKIIAKSSGLYETLLEAVLAMPTLLVSKKVRSVLTAGTALTKVAKGYLGWELGVKPAVESLLRAKSIDVSEFGVTTERGFSVYRVVPAMGTDAGYELVMVDDPRVVQFMKDTITPKNGVLELRSIPHALNNPPADIKNFVEKHLIEGTYVLSDYTISLHIGDILNMAMTDQMIYKHGGHAALLAWNLSPFSFFTDWFTKIVQSVLADLDLAGAEHLYRGTYSNKMTIIEPPKFGSTRVTVKNVPKEDIFVVKAGSGTSSTRKKPGPTYSYNDIVVQKKGKITSVFERKMFDPQSLPAAPFEKAVARWSHNDVSWRGSILAAIIAAVMGELAPKTGLFKKK